MVLCRFIFWRQGSLCKGRAFAEVRAGFLPERNRRLHCAK
jgi:hypothetical protein